MVKWSIALLLAALAAQATAQTTLRFWAVTGSVLDVGMYRELAKRHEARTGVRVEVTPLAWGNFASKYFTAMAAGLPPDAGATNLGGPYDYGSVGGLVDLRAEFPEETKELESRFNPRLLPMFTVGESLYGVPTDLGALVLIYRKDTFARLGIQPPKTWSELDRAIATLEANRYRFHYGWTFNAQWALNAFTMPFGVTGSRIGEDGKPVVEWRNPDYQKGVLQALRLWHMHDSPGKDVGSRAAGMFRSDEPDLAVPLIADLHATADLIRNLAPEVVDKMGVLPWPRADDGEPYNIMGGLTYVVFRKSRHPREAFEWVRYLSSPEAQRFMVLHRMRRGEDSGLMIPGIAALWQPENDAFWAQDELAKVQEAKRVVAETYQSFGSVPILQGSAEVGRIESNVLDQMGTFVHDQIAAAAAQTGLRRNALIQAFGKGQHADLKAAIETRTADKLRQLYAEAAPRAEATLLEADRRHRERNLDVIRNLDAYERKASLLDGVKWTAGFGLLAMAAAVAFRPRLRRHIVPYLYVAVPVVLAVVFVAIPAATALLLSFTDYHPVLPLSTAQAVGWRNYEELFASGDLGRGLVRTLKYVVWTLPTGIVLSLLFAYLLNTRLAGQRFWRFLYFSPLVTSVVSVALIFSQLFLFGPQGWLNSALLSLGWVKDPVPFLLSEHTFLDCVIVLAIWHGLAFTILVFLAGLQQVPNQLFEAAHLDGAGPASRFWHVALPGIRPQVFFVTVLGVIGSFQVFETIYTLAGKGGDAGARFGPNDAALTVVPLIFHKGFEALEMGKAAAAAYVLFVLVLALTLVQVLVYQRGDRA